MKMRKLGKADSSSERLGLDVLGGALVELLVRKQDVRREGATGCAGLMRLSV